MRGRYLAVLAAVAIVALASSDLMACGDKFLRAGRSARGARYAAVFPASILIYTPHATAKGVKEFESLLKKAGHKPVAVTEAAVLTKALAASTYDVVITDYTETARVKEQFNGSGAPGVLPILQNASSAEEKEVVKQYQFVIKPEKMTKFDALEQIDQLMKLRRK